VGSLYPYADPTIMLLHEIVRKNISIPSASPADRMQPLTFNHGSITCKETFTERHQSQSMPWPIFNSHGENAMQLTHELEDWIGKTVSPQSGAARDRTNFELGPRLEHKLSALLSKVLAKHVRSTVKILSTDSKVDLSRNLPLRLTSNTILRIFNNASHYMVRKEPGLNKSYINIVNNIGEYAQLVAAV
jgi:hypothetical protein